MPFYDAKRFLIFHLGYDKSVPVCPHSWCTKIFLTVVKFENGVPVVETKNRILLDEFLFEKMSVVKHANGKDWWVITNTEIDSAGIFKNRFYRFLVSDTVVSDAIYQDIGIPTQNYLFAGQMKFSNEGTLLALVKIMDNVFEIYDFNRCNGTLSNRRSGSINVPQYAYGIAVSKNDQFLYISTGFASSGDSKLFQVDLHKTSLLPSQIGNTQYLFAQLQLAPNGKIYIANQCGTGSNEQVFSPCNQYLSVINNPDTVAPFCDFQPFRFYLGDSSKSSLGLPNMPNYNLDALSIYKADAGEEKTWCVEDTTIKGFILGVPSVEGVQYSWHPSDSLSSNNTAQPFASPSQTTMYVVTLTDTSIKYSCQSRVDSVFVEVRDCSVGIEDILQNEINIFPNPANETLTVSSGNLQFSIHHVIITDINGKRIMNFTQSSVNISLLPDGLYFLRVELTSGESVVRKIVVQ